MSPRSSSRRQQWVGCWVATCILALALDMSGPPASAQEIISTFLVPSQAVQAGGTVSVWLVFLNTTDRRLSQRFPPKLDGKVRAGTIERAVSIPLRNAADEGEVAIAPGEYARREYALTLPEGLEGSVILSATGIVANAVVLDVQKMPVVAAAPATTSEAPAAQPEPGSEGFDPQRFFKEHIFGHEPFYFIAGTKSPNAKFQISFKYRLMGERGALVQRYPALKGFYFAYTQTSLWDWNAPSAPFLDSSYKPEFLYAQEQVDGRRWGEGFRLDVQAGVQHESNGKGGDDSRSLNSAYLQPTLVVGKQGNLQLSLAPRAWVYLGSLSDNPDIARYRGYFGLRAIAGWSDGLQLSAIGRAGDAWDRGSLQLDLTLPLMRLVRWLSEYPGLYLHLQYFWGYGETLLRYKERTSSVRAGFSLYR